MDLLRAFLSEKRKPWLICGHPCEELSPWFSVVSLNLRLSFTRIITDCVTDDFVTSFFVWKEKILTHPWTSVWRVSPWFSVVSLNLRLRFTWIITDEPRMDLLRAFLCQEKEKSVTHPWTSVWRVVPMILSSVPLSEIKFHTDYHGLFHGWFCYERFYVRKKRKPWLIRGYPCEALSPWFAA